MSDSIVFIISYKLIVHTLHILILILNLLTISSPSGFGGLFTKLFTKLFAKSFTKFPSLKTFLSSHLNLSLNNDCNLKTFLSSHLNLSLNNGCKYLNFVIVIVIVFVFVSTNHFKSLFVSAIVFSRSHSHNRSRNRNRSRTNLSIFSGKCLEWWAKWIYIWQVIKLDMVVMTGRAWRGQTCVRCSRKN